MRLPSFAARMLPNLRFSGRTVALVLTIVFLGGLAGLLGYAHMQWRQAKAAVSEGHAKDARAKINFCLLLWPNNVEVHLLAARASWLSGDLDNAEAQLKECTRLGKGATEEIQLEYFLMRAETGEEDEVVPALFKHVDNKHPQSSFILETLSRAYMHRLRYGMAHECLSRWIKEAPDSPALARAYHWRGWVLEHLNNHQGAMKDYQEALERAPELVAVRLRLAELLLDFNKAPEAAPHLERLAKQFPDRLDVMARLGHCRFLQGRIPEARRLLETAIARRPEGAPEDAPAMLYLGRLELQERHAAEGEKWLRRALKAEPADLISRYTLAMHLQANGRREEAAAALKEYKELKTINERANRLLLDEAEHPSRGPAIPSEIGSLLLQIGQEKLGLYWLEQALARDPGHRPTHETLAGYYEKNGKRDKAAAHRRWLNEPVAKKAG